jgi:hypothetical protein
MVEVAFAKLRNGIVEYQKRKQTSAIMQKRKMNRFTIQDYLEGGFMNNKFTRKEVKCPLNGNKFCDHAANDCNRCISEEEQWQEEQCRRECEK